MSMTQVYLGKEHALPLRYGSEVPRHGFEPW